MDPQNICSHCVVFQVCGDSFQVCGDSFLVAEFLLRSDTNHVLELLFVFVKRL